MAYGRRYRRRAFRSRPRFSRSRLSGRWRRRRFRRIARRFNFSRGLASSKKSAAFTGSAVTIHGGIAGTYSRININQIAQGTDLNERIGYYIRPTSLLVQASLAVNASSVGHNIVHVIVVKEFILFADATPPTAGDLWGENSASNVLLLRDLDPRNAKNYKVVRHKVVNIYGANFPVKNIRMMIKRGLPKRMGFDGPANTTYNSGLLWVFFISNASEAAPTSISYSIRMRFVDLN